MKYIVRDGCTHGINDEYEAGDIVKMSPAEARGFSDKLRLVETKEEKPHWFSKIMNTYDLETPEEILSLSDEQVLEVNRIGKSTLEEVRELYPKE